MGGGGGIQSKAVNEVDAELDHASAQETRTAIHRQLDVEKEEAEAEEGLGGGFS